MVLRQVEHTITEQILDIDLVKTQILIARGASIADPALGIPRTPKAHGAAIQCRVTSEMPWMGKQPNKGSSRSDCSSQYAFNC